MDWVWIQFEFKFKIWMLKPASLLLPRYILYHWRFWSECAAVACRTVEICSDDKAYHRLSRLSRRYASSGGCQTTNFDLTWVSPANHAIDHSRFLVKKLRVCFPTPPCLQGLVSCNRGGSTTLLQANRKHCSTFTQALSFVWCVG